MKKNILAIIILAATLVNVTLSVITIFTIVPKAQRTDALIQKICSIIDLELENPDALEYAEIPMKNRETYSLAETITVNLSNTEGDTKNRFAQVKVTLLLNNASEDYAEIQPKLATYEPIIESIISDIITTYNKDNIVESKEAICKEAYRQLMIEFGSADVLIAVDYTLTYQ